MEDFLISSKITVSKVFTAGTPDFEGVTLTPDADYVRLAILRGLDIGTIAEAVDLTSRGEVDYQAEGANLEELVVLATTKLEKQGVMALQDAVVWQTAKDNKSLPLRFISRGEIIWRVSRLADIFPPALAKAGGIGETRWKMDLLPGVKLMGGQVEALRIFLNADRITVVRDVS